MDPLSLASDARGVRFVINGLGPYAIANSQEKMKPIAAAVVDHTPDNLYTRSLNSACGPDQETVE
jgi:hypothetical protein